MIKKIIVIYALGLFVSLPVSAKTLYTGKPEQKPLEVAVAFLQDKLPSGDAEGKQIVTLQQSRIYCKSSQLCPLQAKIALTIDGLDDDSIKKKRYELILQFNANQSWEIIKQDITQICQKARGNQNFSKALCR
ncbi:hypothetical protein [Commensalibacter communis]|uniref:hypothetical protein n=1 Tax=Commensalibacter communis TaxID=2972786 RepID=UPI0022FF648B|nr:hypothetical protein [Commensalibacter communis]CAI3958953.1 unnamed protein product [Commensalibacter communis]CAI3959413.1 unnamed protein product [Commensalibacter communis]